MDTPPANLPWPERPALTFAEMVRGHEDDIDSLLTWRAEIRGMVTLAKVMFGTSILSAAVSVVALVKMFSATP